MEYLMVKPGRTLDMMPAPAADGAMPITHEQRPAPEPPTSLERAGPSHRRHLRIRADQLMAKVRVGDGSVVAKVDDISMGGLFASTTRAIPVGAFVELALIRPGADEVKLGGVIVDDAERRRGLAIRFEAMSPNGARQVKRIVEEQQDRALGKDPDRGVERTRLIRAPDATAHRDEELNALRARMAELQAENELLKKKAEAGDAAVALAGRLQLDIERLKGRHGGGGGVDLEALADIRRDAELAWTAIARLTDAVDRLR